MRITMYRVTIIHDGRDEGYRFNAPPPEVWKMARFAYGTIDRVIVTPVRSVRGLWVDA